MIRFLQNVLTLLLIVTFLVGASNAGDYYTTVPGLPTILIGADGAGATPANQVLGKEYSHNDWATAFQGRSNPDLISLGDHNAFGVPDPLQVVSWDGIAGRIGGNSGSVDAFEYGRAGFNCPECQVDAIANRGDYLFSAVVNNFATLLFSTTGDLDASSVLTGAAPVIVPKAHVHFEAPVGPTMPMGHGIWAGFEAPPAAMGPGVNHHTVVDLDGLEVWGPEPPSHDILVAPSPVNEGYLGPGPGSPRTADSNRFSIDNDAGNGGISVWAYDSASGFSAPWVLHSEIVIAIEKLFLPAGFRFDDTTARLIDIDALMTQDDAQGSPTAPLWNPGDELLFSIDPISGGTMLSPTGAPSPAPTIDGGEVMHLEKIAPGVGPATIDIAFLKHGGHVWNTAFPVATTFGYFYEDVDALEAVGTLTGDIEIPTPEPSSAVMALLTIAVWACRSNRGA